MNGRLSWPLLHPARRTAADWAEAALIALVFALALAAFALTARDFGNPLHAIDFRVYYVAARFLNEGASPYRAVELTGQAYLYPPFFAAMLRPLAMLSVEQAATIWYALNVGSVLVLAGLCARYLRLRARAVPVIVLVLALLPPVQRTLVMGQVTLLLTVLLLAAMMLASSATSHTQRGRDALAGGLIGLAAAVKIFPAVLWVSFALRRRFALVVSSAATLAASVALGLWLGGGWGSLQAFASDVPAALSRGNSYMANQSIVGVVERLFSVTDQATRVVIGDPNLTQIHLDLQPVVALPPAVFRAISLTLSAAVLAVTLGALGLGLRRTRRALPIDVDFAMLLPAVILASTLGWDHYFLMLVVTTLVLIRFGGLDTRAARMSFWLAMLCLFVDRAHTPLAVWTRSAWVTAFGLMCAGIFWLLAVRLCLRLSARAAIHAERFGAEAQNSR